MWARLASYNKPMRMLRPMFQARHRDVDLEDR
jgi:hypothetical protein